MVERPAPVVFAEEMDARHSVSVFFVSDGCYPEQNENNDVEKEVTNIHE
jgi:sulfur relay (sulfurtransferase) complex TusBCD TusD component (DsrE family)